MDNRAWHDRRCRSSRRIFFFTPLDSLATWRNRAPRDELRKQIHPAVSGAPRQAGWLEIFE
jgi:hypothetical protein